MKTITEKELQSAAETPGNGWFIIEAAGDHPHTYPDDDGKELEFLLHVPTEALEAVAAAGVPAEGLLVDKDHLSHDLDKSTEAFGWVKELAMCEGNLAARIEWTPLGLPLVAGKVYKHFSTEYSFSLEDARNGSVTPTQLTGLALTNRPCNKVGQPAISSREGGAPLNPGQGGQGDEKKQQEPKTAMNAQILEALGLSETATTAAELWNKYAQWQAPTLYLRNLHTMGSQGILSTFLGLSADTDHACCLAGDLAVLRDMAAPSLLHQLAPGRRVIAVLANDGAAPSVEETEDDPELHRLLCQPPTFRLSDLAALWGAEYYPIHTESDLEVLDSAEDDTLIFLELLPE